MSATPGVDVNGYGDDVVREPLSQRRALIARRLLNSRHLPS